MDSQKPDRRPYAAPRLNIYGDLAMVTRTVAESMNKNDSIQGSNNLKT